MSESPPFPLFRFGGNKPGPRLLISAGVHGDEYLPMLAVQKLVQHFEESPALSDSLAGTLTLIPVVNESAFSLGRRCGEDGKDLARTCPGSPKGTITERVAAALSREIKSADFYVDLHTGGTELSVFPLAGYVLHPDQTILEKQRELARSFQLPFCWGTSAGLKGRSLSVARDENVPAIYVEYFGAHRELSEATRGISLDHTLVHGCLNVARHLGLFAEEESTRIAPEFIEDTRPDSGHMQVCHPAPATGFFRSRVELGQEVGNGALLAQITPPESGETIEVRANRAGKVIVLRDYPRIKQGDAIAVIADPFPQV
ncbi:MAG: succinylglutamate desuccinylase/aspartoacylase family protein [Verrucomicrobiales bacterium]|nr:succinylglutamate desuccinylase/aspartoacylase family protein [Verrucomicrobiales bacterium]